MVGGGSVVVVEVVVEGEESMGVCVIGVRIRGVAMPPPPLIDGQKLLSSAVDIAMCLLPALDMT